MWRAQCEWIRGSRCELRFTRDPFSREKTIAVEHGGERDAAEAGSDFPKEFSSRATAKLVSWLMTHDYPRSIDIDEFVQIENEQA
jgi:hypothetical protein